MRPSTALEAAIPTPDPAEVYVVAHKALASALKVIARADDSSGIIGDACRRLLELDPTAAAAAQVPAGSLADWMMRFQSEQAEPQILTILHSAFLGRHKIPRYLYRLWPDHRGQQGAGRGSRPAGRPGAAVIR